MDNNYITVKRKLPFNHENRKEMEDWYATAYTSIGAYYQSLGSMKIASGLNSEEERELLPEILGVAAEDKIKFMEARNKYFKEIDTDIPKDGRKLNIGLRDNDKPFSVKKGEENLPLETEDYIRYRHLIGHPQVALDEVSALSNPLKKYWVEDPNQIIERRKKANEVKDLAVADYLEIKNNNNKVDMVLIAMGFKPEKLEDKLVTLRNQAEVRPELFHKTTNDPDLPYYWEMERMVHAGVLDRIGQRFVLPDTAEEIAGDNREMVLWMKDKKNSKDLQILRTQLKTKFDTDFDKLESDDNAGNAHKGRRTVSRAKQQQEQEHSPSAD